MQVKLLISALVASVCAQVDYRAAVEARDGINVLAPRQTFDSKCQSAVLSAQKSMPTVPAEIRSAIMANTQTDPCHYSTPASLSKEFSSYSAELASWASKNRDVASSCSITQVNTIVPSCGSSGRATKTSGGSASGNTAKSTNGVAGETGMAVAAVAAAGIAVIAL